MLGKIDIVDTDSGTVGVYFNGKPIYHRDGDELAQLLSQLGFDVDILEVSEDCVDGDLPPTLDGLVVQRKTHV
jgi:hypothetical protein